MKYNPYWTINGDCVCMCECVQNAPSRCWPKRFCFLYSLLLLLDALWTIRPFFHPYLFMHLVCSNVINDYLPQKKMHTECVWNRWTLITPQALKHILKVYQNIFYTHHTDIQFQFVFVYAYRKYSVEITDCLCFSNWMGMIVGACFSTRGFPFIRNQKKKPN